MTTDTAFAAPKLGLHNPTFDSQAIFRDLMSATAYPGRQTKLSVLPASPVPLSPAMTALCLTLFDFETPIWLCEKASSPEVISQLRFHCGSPIVTRPNAAKFAVIADPPSMPRLHEFNPGEDLYPDKSTTLCIQVASLTAGVPIRWKGPGIKETVVTRIAGLPHWFWSDWQLNREIYPKGVDVFLVAADTVVGLPRSITVEA